MEDRYLAIGTIVTLNEDINMYMIVGYLIKDKNALINDYISIPFPYGMMSINAIKYFNHNDIENIVFNGYKNETYELLNKKLHEIIEKGND